MKCLSVVILQFIILCISTTLSGQRFPCDGSLLIANNDGVTTRLMTPVFIPFGPAFLSPTVNYFNSRFEATGFNSKDNFIYAVQEESNAIVRLKSDGTYDTVGIVSIVDTLDVNAGDCTVDGLYLIYERSLSQILVFDVVENFELLQRIDLYWDPTSSNSGLFTTRIFDFAVDPNNPTIAITYQGTDENSDLLPDITRGYLHQINIDLNAPDVGMVTPMSVVDTEQISHLGALAFFPQGTLQGFGSADSGLNPIQNKLFSINQLSGDVTQVLRNPMMELSDGCSCPFSFNFYCRVPTEGMFCSGDQKTIFLTITNNSYNSLDDIILRDTLPIGTVIENVTGVMMENVGTINGIGSDILEIIDLDLPPKSTTEIEISFSSIDAVIGATYNQAYLENLPEKFGGVMPSDDRSTTVRDDASLFIVVPLSLEDVKYEVVKPTDCLEANDGQIILSSPQFISGQEYELLVRNRMGWAEKVFEVVADQDNSFLLDSLVPGEYRFLEIKNKNENCGLAIRSFFIDVDPPNNDLDLEINAKSPLCKGEELILNSNSQNASYIRWTGPNLYGSEDPTSIIENADEDNSGMYYIAAEYGYCSKYDTIEVIVKPLVNTIISGDSIYCERDQLILTAEGVGGDLSHMWTGPDNRTSLSASVSVTSVTTESEGYYEVISSNGACIDTVGIDIEVLPTPTLLLPEVILTDFCNSETLQPIITGDDDVNYTWFPQEGLSCADCPTPILEPIVQPSYQLIVENTYFCKDSADVSIELNKAKLIYIPNIFIAEDIGTNGSFGLFPGCAILNINNLNIYDRWGQLVYASDDVPIDDVSDSWDGYIRGRLGNSGVYVWTAEVELVDGSIELLTGDVTILASR